MLNGIIDRLHNLSPEAQAKADERARLYEQREAERRTRCAIDYLKRHVPKRYYGVSLHTFEVSNKQQAAALEQCREIARDLDNYIAAGNGLLLIGTVGTGKDHLALSLLKIAAAHGHLVSWRQASTVYTQIADAYREDRTHGDLYAELDRPAILCLSDPLDPRNWTPSKADAFAKIVKRRYDAGRATWITANLENENQAADLAGLEVIDRLVHRAAVIRCDWESYRKPL